MLVSAVVSVLTTKDLFIGSVVWPISARVTYAVLCTP